MSASCQPVNSSELQLLLAVTETLNTDYESTSLDQVMDRILPKFRLILLPQIGSGAFTLRVYFTDFELPSAMDLMSFKFQVSSSQQLASSQSKCNHVEPSSSTSSKSEASKKRKKKTSTQSSSIDFKNIYQISSDEEESVVKLISSSPSLYQFPSASQHSFSSLPPSPPFRCKTIPLEDQPNFDLYQKVARDVVSSGTFSYSNHSSESTSTSSLPIRSNRSSITSTSSSSCEGAQTIVGLMQLIVYHDKGKEDNVKGEVKESDVPVFESLARVFGTIFNFCQMSEIVKKMMVRQRVTFEACSFHCSASIQDGEEFMKLDIPSVDQLKIYEYKFCDFNLSDNQTCQCILRMFMELDFIKKFNIPLPVLCRWILTVKRNYRPVIYHNWRHSLNVTQTMFAMLTSGQMCKYFSDLEQLALLIACLCHDLDHRGTNNSFLAKTASPLALLYSTSTLERHHFDQCILILHSEGNNILDSLNSQQYSDAIHVIKTAIISTDLALYMRKREKFVQYVQEANSSSPSSSSSSWRCDSERKDSLIGMMMTASDVSAITKPWPIQRKICESTTEEFFQQGDIEKELWKDLDPDAMMDRKMKHQLPALQVEFISKFCEPTYQILADCWPLLKPLLDGCLENKSSWEHLSKQQEKIASGEMLDPS